MTTQPTEQPPPERRRFYRWRSKLPQNGRYLADQVLAIIVPEMERKGFRWYADHGGGSDAVEWHCIPLECTKGSYGRRRLREHTMTNDKYDGLCAELPPLRRLIATSRFGDIPASVDHLVERLDRTMSADGCAALYSLLLSECSKTRRDDLQLRFLRQRVTELPDDPLSLASLGYALALKSSSRDEAVETAVRALELPRAEDTRLEFDFLGQIDASRCRRELLARYRKLAPRAQSR